MSAEDSDTMGDFFRDWKVAKDEAKSKRLANAETIEMTGWTKHTPYHWSRMLSGKKLNWYPSTGKWSWGDNKMISGSQADLVNFIKRRTLG